MEKEKGEAARSRHGKAPRPIGSAGTASELAARLLNPNPVDLEATVLQCLCCACVKLLAHALADMVRS